MQKILTASLLLVILAFLQTEVFAATLKCNFKNTRVTGVRSILISDESLIINKEMEIPLEKSQVKCGHFGRQTRLDGAALGYQVILKSCTTESVLEGVLIDSVNSVAADVYCNEAR
ncbi:MAG TPA: hypothetical protein VNJ01_09415 [Bacteriovoracaceae bacterium]|nr:hypothetical protein [Bacteriovoracaceae bacterium]